MVNVGASILLFASGKRLVLGGEQGVLMGAKRDRLTMEISSEDDGIADIAVLKIAGHLDFSGIAALSGIFDKVAAENKRFIVVDMAGIDAICSAAFGEFMGYRKKFVESGGDLVFAGLLGNIRSKFTALGANRIFAFYQDVRGAINAYKWDYMKCGKSVSVTIPPTLMFVPPVRQLASRLAKQYGYTVKDAFRVETIVDEVCNNAVDHGRKDCNVVVQVAIDKEKVDITVINQSDPDKIPALKELIGPAGQHKNHVGSDDKRGRGLALIRMLSNDMNVDITEHGTSVRVIKLREE